MVYVQVYLLFVNYFYIGTDLVMAYTLLLQAELGRKKIPNYCAHLPARKKERTLFC